VLVVAVGIPDFVDGHGGSKFKEVFTGMGVKLPPFTVFVPGWQRCHPVPYSANAGSDSG